MGGSPPHLQIAVDVLGVDLGGGVLEPLQLSKPPAKAPQAPGSLAFTADNLPFRALAVIVRARISPPEAPPAPVGWALRVTPVSAGCWPAERMQSAPDGGDTEGPFGAEVCRVPVSWADAARTGSGPRAVSFVVALTRRGGGRESTATVTLRWQQQPALGAPEFARSLQGVAAFALADAAPSAEAEALVARAIHPRTEAGKPAAAVIYAAALPPPPASEAAVAVLPTVRGGSLPPGWSVRVRRFRSAVSPPVRQQAGELPKPAAAADGDDDGDDHSNDHTVGQDAEGRLQAVEAAAPFDVREVAVAFRLVLERDVPEGSATGGAAVWEAEESLVAVMSRRTPALVRASGVASTHRALTVQQSHPTPNGSAHALVHTASDSTYQIFSQVRVELIDNRTGKPLELRDSEIAGGGAAWHVTAPCAIPARSSSLTLRVFGELAQLPALGWRLQGAADASEGDAVDLAAPSSDAAGGFYTLQLPVPSLGSRVVKALVMLRDENGRARLPVVHLLATEEPALVRLLLRPRAALHPHMLFPT